MSKHRVALLTTLIAACIFICCTGINLSAASQKTDAKIDGDSAISSFCNTIIKDECTWARMKDDGSVYQINIITDYTPYDIKEILLTDCVDKAYFLNASAFRDLEPMKKIYLKYLNKDEEVLVEIEFSRSDTESKYEFSSYSVNTNYLKIYNSVLSGGN